MPDEPLLQKVRKDIKSTFSELRANSGFTITPNEINKDPTLRDFYRSPFKGTSRITIFFGPIWIEDAVGIEKEESNSKQPVYHYSDTYFSTVLPGKYLVRGRLYLFKGQEDILATIAKYKEMLRRENREIELIRSIVDQRNNLFEARLTTRLVMRYGPDKAREIARSAIKRINTEIVTGFDWDVPKLILVSGELADPNAEIQVFEDITFLSDAESVVSDGSTVVRILSFMGRRRQMHERPPRGQIIEGFKIDLVKTANSLAENLVSRIIPELKVTIKPRDLPSKLNASRMFFTGSIPNVVSGWGPNMCTLAFDVVQQGPVFERDYLNFTFFIYSYGSPIRTIEDAIASLDEDSELRERQDEALGTISSPWKYFVPDPDYLEHNTVVASRAIPTNYSLAYSWIYPPLAIPSVKTSESDNVFDYVYLEEERYAITGSSLCWAFKHTRFEQTYKLQPDSRTFLRKPVRALSVAGLPYIYSKGDAVFVDERSPVLLATLDKAVSSFEINYEEVLIPSNLKPITQKEESVAVVERVLNKEILKSYTKEPTYEEEVWFLFAPKWTQIVMDNDSVFVNISGNPDRISEFRLKLNDYLPSLANMDSLGNVPMLGVQVYGVLANPNIDDDVRANIINVASFLDTGKHLERGEAQYILSRSTCMEETDFKYLYTITGINTVYDKYLNFAFSLKRSGANRAVSQNLLPLILVRIICHKLENPSLPDSYLSDAYQNETMVSPISKMQCARLVNTVVIRTDRNYIQFEPGLLRSFLEALANISNSSSYKNPDLKSVALWQGTYYATTRDRTFLEGLVETPIEAAGIAGLVLLDTIEGIYTITRKLPIIKQAVDLVGSVFGVNLDAIFGNSVLYSNLEKQEALGLKNVAVYCAGYRYYVLLDDLARTCENILMGAVEDLMDRQPDLFSIGESDELPLSASAAGRSVRDICRRAVENALETKLRENGWIVWKLSGEETSRFFQLLERAGPVEQFTDATRNTTVMVIERRNPIPSSLVLDLYVRGPEYLEDDTGNTPTTFKGFL